MIFMMVKMLVAKTVMVIIIIMHNITVTWRTTTDEYRYKKLCKKLCKKLTLMVPQPAMDRDLSTMHGTHTAP